MRKAGAWSKPSQSAVTGIARYIAAHSPTERAQLQTAMVARRLSRGEAIYEADGQEDRGLEHDFMTTGVSK